MKIIRVVAAIIFNVGNVFATQRGYGDFKGGWEFPGGKIDAGETPEEALVREIKEELDTEVEVKELLDTVEYDYPNFHLSMDCFICSIKSGDLVLHRKIRLNPELKDLQTYFSNLDMFDIAFPWGIGSVLDGMFTCTPVNSKKLIEAMHAGDKAGAAEALDNITAFRDKMFGWGDFWPAYNAAMNLLGWEGLHAPDWATYAKPEMVALVKAEMQRIGEL